ncbi:MAG: hypothetical protein Q8P67_13770 [archaeon]|nr:hypothetical protein [archaeon]
MVVDDQDMLGNTHKLLQLFCGVTEIQQGHDLPLAPFQRSSCIRPCRPIPREREKKKKKKKRKKEKMKK